MMLTKMHWLVFLIVGCLMFTACADPVSTQVTYIEPGVQPLADPLWAATYVLSVTTEVSEEIVAVHGVDKAVHRGVMTSIHASMPSMRRAMFEGLANPDLAAGYVDHAISGVAMPIDGSLRAWRAEGPRFSQEFAVDVAMPLEQLVMQSPRNGDTVSADRGVEIRWTPAAISDQTVEIIVLPVHKMSGLADILRYSLRDDGSHFLSPAALASISSGRCSIIVSRGKRTFGAALDSRRYEAVMTTAHAIDVIVQ